MKVTVKKIGLFLNGQLMIEYPYDDGRSFFEAVNDCKMAIEETGLFHELKIYEDKKEMEANE